MMGIKMRYWLLFLVMPIMAYDVYEINPPRPDHERCIPRTPQEPRRAHRRLVTIVNNNNSTLVVKRESSPIPPAIKEDKCPEKNFLQKNQPNGVLK